MPAHTSPLIKTNTDHMNMSCWTFVIFGDDCDIFSDYSTELLISYGGKRKIQASNPGQKSAGKHFTLL